MNPRSTFWSGVMIGAAVVVGYIEYLIRRDMAAIRFPRMMNERCEYRFPWSGQCSRPNHHDGRHF